MRIMPGISIINLVTANLAPKAESSNKNIGIFVVDHAPIKMSTLLNLTPFFIYPAPLFNSIAAVGKATNHGINVIAPTTVAKITSSHSDSLPMILDMNSASNAASNIPTSIITPKNCGKIFSKDLQLVYYFYDVAMRLLYGFLLFSS
ncbi:hypothetical protein QBE52_14780 [Clostridiaceae bacterium 35-E11]